MAKTTSKKEMFDMFQASSITFRNMLKRAGLIGENTLFTECQFIKIRLFTPLEVEKIFEKLGDPEKE